MKNIKRSPNRLTVGSKPRGKPKVSNVATRKIPDKIAVFFARRIAPGMKGCFYRPNSRKTDSGWQQRIDGLNDLLGAARLKVHFATARADPCFEPGEFHRHALFLELLGDGLAPYLATALGALGFRPSFHVSRPLLRGVIHHGL